MEQQLPGYHPKLRFNASSTFIFQTPDYIAEGHYTQQGTNYYFHPELAFELNHADVDKLTADLDPESRDKQQKAYARSLFEFPAEYVPSSGMLSLPYPVEGVPTTFALYPFTAGDDSLISTLSASERGLAGVWCAPDPFPEKLDSKTRYRIGGLEGLQRFCHEAIASDSAQFGVIDLRVDGTYRSGGKMGYWSRDGSTVKLVMGIQVTTLTISPDGGKLMSGGRTAYVR
jgi:hypothetical protein